MMKRQRPATPSKLVAFEDFCDMMTAGKEQREQGEQRREPEFIGLENASRVIAACERAMRRADFTVIVGPPGTGKSVALREFVRRSAVAGREVIYDVCSPAIRVGSLSKNLLRRFELADTGTAFDQLERLLSHFERHPVPIVLDEANHLDVPCLESLRYVSDQAHVPIVLAGSMRLQRTLSQAGDKHYELEQLQSRVGQQVLLTPMSVEEVSRIVRVQLDGAPGELAVAFHAKSRGVARVLFNLIERVRASGATVRAKTLTPQAVELAAEQLVGAAGA